MRHVLQTLSFVLCIAAPAIACADTVLGTVVMPTLSQPASAANVVTDRFYVTSSNSSGIMVLRRTGAELGTFDSTKIPVNAAAMVADPVANRIYVSDQAAAQVVIIDGPTHGTTPIALAANPGPLAVNTVAGKLYVTLPSANTVAVIDLATLGVTPVAVVANPNVIVVDPVSNRTFVGSNTNAGLTVIDGATLAPTPLVLPNPVNGLAVDTTPNRIYATGSAGGGVGFLTRIDGVGGGTTSVAAPAGPRGIAVDVLTGRVYVGASGAQYVVAMFDGTTLQRTDFTNGGFDCCQAAVNPTSGKAYLPAAGFSCTICPPSGPTTVVENGAATTLSGVGAMGFAINSVNNRIYETNNYAGPLATQIGTLSVVDGTPIAPRTNGLVTTIGAQTANSVGTTTPRFTFTTSTTSPLPVQRVYYKVDGVDGEWQPASGGGSSWSATLSALSPGSHVLRAFAVDARAATPSAPLVGEMASYAFTVTNDCGSVACADVSVSQTPIPTQASTDKDLVVKLVASNFGPAQATNVVMTDTLPVGVPFIWASPACAHSAGVLTCNLGTMEANTSSVHYFAVRPTTPGTVTNTVSITAGQLDPQTADNQSVVAVPVSTSPAGVPILRYRLYSPVTLEHHFTTDFNEYTVLGSYSGTWVQEGTVGKVLNNPGSFNGVQAVPYYRLYDTGTQWHHWTTDPNEYYTLALVPTWNAEGVDGFILPTATAGATELYRLNYPYIPGLHHWTIDANEYNTLISSYGWVGEPGAGFVVQ